MNDLYDINMLKRKKSALILSFEKSINKDIKINFKTN